MPFSPDALRDLAEDRANLEQSLIGLGMLIGGLGVLFVWALWSRGWWRRVRHPHGRRR